MVDSIRIPPESTGPRIGITSRYVLEYDTQLLSFEVGDIIDGATSSATGKVTGIETQGYSATAGRLYLSEVTGTFINNELIQISAVTYATVNTTTQEFLEYSTQNVVVTDPDNPTNQQKFDAFGSALTTFSSGSPVIGAFGGLSVGELQAIKTYRFAYGLNSTDFWDQTASGGTITYESAKGTVLLSTTTANNSTVSRTSNFYHPYNPGVGTMAFFSIQLGDTGKAGLDRHWGLFDDDNGVFFGLNDTTFKVAIRSNTTGSVVTTYVSQSDFSYNKVDGTGPKGFSLDVTKANVYWIDYQWLGAGRVDFGILNEDGEQVLLHRIKNGNSTNLPYMRTGTLPIRVSQRNTSSVGSSSEMRWACAVVAHQSSVKITGTRFSSGLSALKTISYADGEVPIISIRPKTTFNGLTNRIISRFKAANYLVSTGSSGPVLFRVRGTNSTNLANASFSSLSSASSVEIDSSATSIISLAATNHTLTQVLSVGESTFNQILSPPEVHEVELFLNADGTTQPCFVVTAEPLVAGNCDIFFNTNWEELVL